MIMHDHHRMQRLTTCGSGCGLRGHRACERQAVRQVTDEHCFCSVYEGYGGGGGAGGLGGLGGGGFGGFAIRLSSHLF